jgi:hypothetical protein
MAYTHNAAHSEMAGIATVSDIRERRENCLHCCYREHQHGSEKAQHRYVSIAT